MKESDHANWDGDSLTAVESFDWPQPHTRITHFSKVPMESPEARYFCAVDGQSFALALPTEEKSCIAGVENALRLAGARAMYITFALQNRTPGTISRWVAKWTKRTTNPHRFDASVRCAV